MRSFGVRAPDILLCTLFLLVGCAKIPRSSESPDARVPPLESPSSESNAPEGEFHEEAVTHALAELQEAVTAGLEEGRLRIEGHETEAARAILQDLLSRLQDSGFELSYQPFLEQAYHEVRSELLTLEVRDSADPVGFPYAGVELSPLDEIGSVNLLDFEVDPLLEAAAADDVQQHQLSFPFELNDNILKAIQYYQGPGRHIMELGLGRSGRYLDLFRRVFEEEDIPFELVYMAHVESLFQPAALSRARARGIWQFMVGTGRLYGLRVDWWVDERMDVEKSTRAAARHLKDLYEEFQDWLLVLAAYNAGPGRIRKNFKRYGNLDFWTMSDKRMLPRETRNHVPSILAAILIFRNPQLYGFEVPVETELTFDRVRVDYQVDLKVLAEELGVPVEDLRRLNPSLQRDVTPPAGSNFELKAPPGTGSRLEGILAELPEEKRLQWRHHRVRNGETLSKIASDYRTSVRAIAETNRLRNIHRLKLGQDLIIPVSGGPAGRPSGKSGVALSGESHVVRKGDSLSRIALMYGVSVVQLTALNGLKPTDTIYPGQKLKIRNPAVPDRVSSQ